LTIASNSKPKLLVVLGATASGKSALVLSLFSFPQTRTAYRLPGAELISADSMQVYRFMDIGTAKPSGAERAALPHHLIDEKDPREQFSAGEFVARAEACAAEIARRGALPVMCGGTAFYVKNFLYGVSEAPPSSDSVRADLRADLERLGAEALHAELAAADPVTAARIHLNDLYRLTRALEVLRLSGKPLSAFAVPDRLRLDYDFLVIGLERPRDELYRRVNRRVELMFEAGLVSEVEALRARGCGFDSPGFQAIGYREFAQAFDGMRVRPALREAVKEAIKQNTRHYVKRQLTFFRALPPIRWFDADDGAAIAAAESSWYWEKDQYPDP
jgi:tRNA dimethylallyltransferase